MRARSRIAAVAAAALAVSGSSVLLTGTSAVADPPVRGAGVWVTSGSGAVEAFGDAPVQGTVPVGLDTAVDLAPTPSGRGYWVLTSTGKVLVRGDALSYGDLPVRTNGSAVALAPTPTGRGYWLLTNKDQLLPFGDAAALVRRTAVFKGSAVDVSATPDGKGVWSTSNKGEVSAFGTAPVLRTPAARAAVVSIQSTPTGKGYLLAAANGQVLAVGDAVQRGEVAASVVDLASTYDGRGYWLLLADRTIRAFGSAVALGPSTSSSTVVALAATPWVNRAPVALDDIATTDEDTSVTVAVGDNDSDPDGDRLSFSVRGRPAHGSVSAGLGGLVYTPDPDFFGDDSVVYTATDEYDATASATVFVTVRPVNDAPVAGNDSVQVDEDGSIVIDVLANDTDVDSADLTVELTGDPDHGKAEVIDNQVRYTPEGDFHGDDGFGYLVTDGQGASSGAGVYVQVLSVDDPPVAVGEGYRTDQGVTLTVAAPGVLGNDSDVDGDTLTAQLVRGPASGTLTLSEDGGFTWVPDPESSASDRFTYQAVGAGVASRPVTVTLSVAPTPTDPGSGGARFTTPGPEIANDDTYDITSYGTPTGRLRLGTTHRTADGRLLYVPDPEVQGVEHLTFSDGTTLDIEVVDAEDVEPSPSPSP